MTFLEVRVSPKKPERLNDVLKDLKTSAAFFGEKDLTFEKDRYGFKFICKEQSKEYLNYLYRKYNFSSTQRLDNSKKERRFDIFTE